MKIALVQFYSYHEEVLAPQVDFLLPDNEVFVAAPKNVFDHDYIKPFQSAIKKIKKIEFTNRKYGSKKIIDVPLRIFSIFIKYIQLNRVVKKENIDLIVFNTINKPFHFKFITLFFRRIDKIHIIHNAQMFLSEKSARPLSLFKKNLFISKDVYNYYLKNSKIEDASLFDWFMPSLASFVPPDLSCEPQNADKITIVVPGGVEDQRRNYTGLIDALSGFNPPPPRTVCCKSFFWVKYRRKNKNISMTGGLIR